MSIVVERNQTPIKAIHTSLSDFSMEQDDFYVNAEFSLNRDTGSIKQFYSSSKHQGKIKFKGLVLDGSNIYGGIFKSWRFSYMKVQRCQTHFKKNLNETIYEAAGLGMKVKEDLPGLTKLRNLLGSIKIK